MGVNDAREQLEVCKDEYGKLERENAELRFDNATLRSELAERVAPPDDDEQEGFLNAVEAALYDVESKHHIHGQACLCGFSSAVARDRTKHIARETMATLLGREVLDEIRI